jgi:Flp pilus assembly protein TadG
MINPIKRNSERGQMLPLVAAFALVLIAFVGLAVDLGFAYITKAQLSKAVDAAALAGMNNINLGTVTAGNVASATFAANYGTNSTGRDVTRVIPNIVFGTDANGNTTLNVGASTRIKTFFVRVLGALPGAPAGLWQNLTVSSTSQVTRATLIVSMALDRSNSMINDGGAGQMLNAVTNFLSVFDNLKDAAGLATFAVTSGVDVAITKNFMTPISTFVGDLASFNFAGYNTQDSLGTYSVGGLTNALRMESGTNAAAGVFVTKAVVFFTDGLANSVRETLRCNGTITAGTDWEFGGIDPPGTGFDLYNPTNGVEPCGNNNSFNDGSKPTCGSIGCNVGTFSSTSGGTLTFTQAHITGEAETRCVQIANLMRSSNIVVYAIGMGNDVNTTFLEQVANDPATPGYVPTANDGIFVYASDSTQMVAAFQRVAEQILLRLTH